MILHPMELGALEWVRDLGAPGFYVHAIEACAAKGWISAGEITTAGLAALAAHHAIRREENLRRNVLPTFSDAARQGLRDLIEGREITWNTARELICHACAYLTANRLEVTPLGREIRPLLDSGGFIR